MMSWRARKQLIATLLILLPVGAILLFFSSRIYLSSSCVDTVRNQGELGVDCGGPCLPCALKNPQPLTLYWSRAVEIGERTFDAVAFIENHNEVVGAPRVEYEFIFYDILGPTAVRSGTTYVLPQEQTHIIEANIKTVRDPVRLEFKIRDISWDFYEGERINLVVERRDYGVSEQSGIRKSVIDANILNRSPFDIGQADVNFIVLDANDNVLGANRIRVEGLLSGVSRAVKSIWPTELYGEIDSIEVEPRANVFNPNVILKP